MRGKVSLGELTGRGGEKEERCCEYPYLHHPHHLRGGGGRGKRKGLFLRRDHVLPILVKIGERGGKEGGGKRKRGGKEKRRGFVLHSSIHAAATRRERKTTKRKKRGRALADLAACDVLSSPILGYQ